MEQKTNYRALSILISVFFFWGFVAASNSILIPLFKEKLNLSQFQAQLIDFAFYAAYFIGTLIYFVVQKVTEKDPLNKIGYKNGIILGLVISAIGALGFYPAAEMQSFPVMLLALFTVGLGFSLQQTAAQPFVIALGDPTTGAHRLNLAGGINNLGTTIGPVLISFAIFGAVSQSDAIVNSLDSIKYPYLILAFFFLLVAFLLKISTIPEITTTEKLEKGFGALKYPQLVLGMTAIFVYVGAEVSIASNLGEYLNQKMHLDASQISQYISLFWGSMMIGRWSGAISVFNPKQSTRLILQIVVPYLAFAVYLWINTIKGSPIENVLAYSGCILILILANIFTYNKPIKSLITYSILGALAMLIGIFGDGNLALFSVISGGLFCSIMWPCIFPMAIAGLGNYTSQGSAFLIMMILGGAIIPPIQGLFSDYVGIANSYFVVFFCFLYLGFFAIKTNSILKKQGLNFDQTNA